MKYTLSLLILLGTLILGIQPAHGQNIPALEGKHKLALQWISWDYFGEASIRKEEGKLRITGEQKSRENEDFLRIDGFIESLEPRKLRFEGTITTQVNYINSGKPCIKEGVFHFRASGSRRYWRLVEKGNCEGGGVVDYVDLFFD